MKRISTYMPNDDYQYRMRLQEWKMGDLQGKIAEQTRVRELRDDPLAAAHSTRFQSKITRLKRFSDNIEKVQGDHRVAEGYMTSANNIILRIRELAIQGSNDTYSKEDKAKMGEEVNQLLNELVEISNAEDGNGNSIFSGDKNNGIAFRAETGMVPGAAGKKITSVEYVGTVNRQETEVSESSYMNTDFPGNRVFWAEQQQVFSSVDASNYSVLEDTSISIDGENIELNAGDNVHAVMAKINDADIAVKAQLDPVTNSIILKSTTPHQIWMEDTDGGSVLKDLGLVSARSGRPPANIDKDARVSGGSLFDMVIALRDNLYVGNTIDIGGKALKGIDMAHNNILSEITRLGAEDERLDTTYKRIAYEIPNIQQMNSNAVDLDFAEAITDLKMMEKTQQATLQTAAKVLKPTLLDYLR
ncbi:MAG: flagellar hook-associated protein 3 [Spirochaetales bacterium]|nr:flagellar hook-associated protein 3 [Spirochaetales bacterium]